MPRITTVVHSFRDGIEGKNCLSCQKWLPLNEYNTDNSKRDKLNIYCKLCRKQKRAIKAKKFNARRREEYVKSPEKILERNKQWRNANKDEINRRCREKRAANPEKYRKQDRDFYKNNREQIIEKTRQKRAKNPHKHRYWNRRWSKRNPEKRTIQRQKRRALLNKSNGAYTVEQWEQLKRKYGYRCLKCNRHEPEIKLTGDHVVPLSKGGSNTIDNIQPLCIQCNSGKKDKIKDYRIGNKSCV